MKDSSLLDIFRSLECDVGNVSEEDLGWMRKVETAEPFLEWFEQYIDTSNICSQCELEEYEHLRADGYVLCGEKLEQALEENNFIKGVLWADDINNVDLLKVQEETQSLQHQAEILENLHTALSEQLKLSEEEETARDKELGEGKMRLIREGQSLMKLKVHIKRSYFGFCQSRTKLLSTFTDSKKPHLQNRFFSQMPLDKFISQCDKFEHNMRQFKQHHFDELNGIKDPDFDRSVFLLSNRTNSRETQTQFNQATLDDLCQVEVRRVLAHADLDGLVASLDCLLRLRKDIGGLNIFQIRLECVSIKDEVTRLCQHVSNLLDKEVAEAVDSVVQVQVAEIAVRHAHQRISRRRCRLDALHTLRSCMDTCRNLVDLVWMLLCREEQWVKICSEFVCDAAEFLQEEKSKHISTMAVLQQVERQHHCFKNAPPTTQCLLLSMLQRILHSAASRFGVSDLELIATLKTEIEKLEVVQLTDLCSVYKENYSSMIKAFNRLTSAMLGATKKPVLLETDLAHRISSHCTTFGNISKEVEALEKDYLKTQSKLNQSPMERASRLLWAWFLVAPNRLEEAVRRAECHAIVTDLQN